MKLTGRLGADYAGCISRGVMEGARFLSEDSQILQRYRKLGEIYEKTGKLDKDLLEKSPIQREYHWLPKRSPWCFPRSAFSTNTGKDNLRRTGFQKKE